MNNMTADRILTTEIMMNIHMINKSVPMETTQGETVIHIQREITLTCLQTHFLTINQTTVIPRI